MMKDQIIECRNQFMKDHNQKSSDVLSFILSEIKNIEINTGKRDGLQDNEIVALLQKNVRKMQEARDLFLKGNRPDLAENENYGIKILNAFLPKLLSEPETELIVLEILKKFENPTIKDIGKIISELKDRNDIDKSLLSKIIKSKLQ